MLSVISIVRFVRRFSLLLIVGTLNSLRLNDISKGAIHKVKKSYETTTVFCKLIL